MIKKFNAVDTEKCPACHMWLISFQRQDPRETHASLGVGSVSGPPPTGEVPHTSTRPPALPSLPHPHGSSLRRHVASAPLTLLKLLTSRTVSQPFFSCFLRVRDTVKHALPKRRSLTSARAWFSPCLLSYSLLTFAGPPCFLQEEIPLTSEEEAGPVSMPACAPPGPRQAPRLCTTDSTGQGPCLCSVLTPVPGAQDNTAKRTNKWSKIFFKMTAGTNRFWGLPRSCYSKCSLWRNGSLWEMQTPGPRARLTEPESSR